MVKAPGAGPPDSVNVRLTVKDDPAVAVLGPLTPPPAQFRSMVGGACCTSRAASAVTKPPLPVLLVVTTLSVPLTTLNVPSDWKTTPLTVVPEGALTSLTANVPSRVLPS